jgi:signal transduction histidine kinase
VALAAFVFLAAAGTAGIVANGEALLPQIPFIVAFGMFGVVGALILSRTEGNRIGALLLYGSCTTAASFAAGELMTYLVLGRGQTEGAAVVAAGLVSNIGWGLGILPVMVLLPLWFPDGRLPSPGWRWLVGAGGLFIGVLLIAGTFGTTELVGSEDAATIANPLFVSALGDVSIPDAVFNVGLLLILGASFSSIAVRFRRSRGVERQQIRWVALALLYFVVALVLSVLLSAFGMESAVLDAALTAPAFLALPVSVAVAVLQYHLYDLDVVVKKTLVAGTLAVLAILVYGVVVGLYALLGTEGASPGSVFVVALLLGLAFRPVTRFVRRFADRIVYGRRATPYEVLTEFSERMGEAYATQDVLSRMAQILAQGAGAESARVWLRVDAEMRPAASWPSGAAVPEPVPAVGDALPALPAETAVEVRDGGELLGALSVTMPVSDPMNPAKERLVRDLASQAGLVLRNVGLVEELRASRRRLVAARDEERRRLERNIHDGAQQQLVALTVKMRLARSLVEKDAEKAAAMLERMQAETQTTLEDLRDLARGIYPPLLADKGLPAALDAQARKFALPVEIVPDGVVRYEPEVEAAVYFSILEALQNAAKYSEATHVAVRLDERDGWLSFEVEDDGRGFEPDLPRSGTGLQGITDRLRALDGSFGVRSSPGAGTIVAGRVPVGERET